MVFLPSPIKSTILKIKSMDFFFLARDFSFLSYLHNYQAELSFLQG